MDEDLKSKGVLTLCHRCQHRWFYKGSNPWACSCPYCHTMVSLKTSARRLRDDVKT